MKKSKGITLIALVITIIVLLILAGIAIASLTGENGILTKASDAQEKTNTASDKERLQVEILGSYNDNGKLVLETLKENIAKNIPEAEVTGDNFPLRVKIGKNLYVVTGKGEVTAKQYTSRDNIKIGDYIDYKPTILEADGNQNTYTLNANVSGYTNINYQTITQEPDLKWRILNINEYGDMDLISDLTTAQIYFYDAKGYNNGVYILHDICEKLYSNKEKGITARSVTLEDMEKWLTEDGKKAKADFISKNLKKLSTSDNTKIKSVDAAKNTVTYNTTIDYPVLWDIQKNESDKYYTEDTLNNALNQSPYTQKANLTVEQTYYEIYINNTNFGEGSEVLSDHLYWVATRCVNPNLKKAEFGLRLASSKVFGSLMFGWSFHFSHIPEPLRAVVTLDSDVQVTPSTGGNSEDNPHHINW